MKVFWRMDFLVESAGCGVVGGMARDVAVVVELRLMSPWRLRRSLVNPGQPRSRRRNAGFDSPWNPRLALRSRVLHNSNVFQCILYASLLPYDLLTTSYRKVNSRQHAVAIFSLTRSSGRLAMHDALLGPMSPPKGTMARPKPTPAIQRGTRAAHQTSQLVPATALSSSFKHAPPP